MKSCSKCNKRIRKDIKSGLCKECATVCKCGNKKDFRAVECLSCGMSRKAKIQWQEKRPKMEAASKKRGLKQRRTFEKLKESDFCNAKIDGRLWAHYWQNGKKKTIYRYQWRWIKAHGAIPKGLVLHHKDHNNTNDDIDNLELMTQSEHTTHHSIERNRAEWICQFCNKNFLMSPRQKGEPRKFCSKKCHYDYSKKHQRKCFTFQAVNEYTAKLIE